MAPGESAGQEPGGSANDDGLDEMTTSDGLDEMTTSAELEAMKTGDLPATLTAEELDRWAPPPVGPQGNANSPLLPSQRNILDEVMAAAERSTGLRFSVYLGDLGADSHTAAESLHSGLGAESVVAVLLAVSPGQHIVEVVTGAEAARRISNRSARLAVLSVIASCSEGDLLGSLVNGVRTLADQAGTLPERTGW